MAGNRLEVLSDSTDGSKKERLLLKLNKKTMADFKVVFAEHQYAKDGIFLVT